MNAAKPASANSSRVDQVTARPPVSIRTAGPVALFVLDLARADGVLSPWWTIYLRPARFDDPALRRHELAHVGQVLRDGWCRFWLLCPLLYVLGNSRYEREAVEAETLESHPLLAWMT